MKVQHYIRDRWALIVGWLSFVFFTIVFLWLSPQIVMDWGTIGYLVLVQAVVLAIYLGLNYYLRIRWWKKFSIDANQSSLQQYLEGATLNEERLIQEYVNQLIREHQEVMQQAITNQQDQKDYLDSWIHEIKVPLAAAELLVRSIEFDIDDKKYTLLQNELGKIDEYVEQVLYYARLDSFSRDYLIQEVGLKEIIQPVIRSQANNIIQKNLRYEILGDDQQVLTDAKWVAFIFRQLLSNAIKYTPDNGRIDIYIKQTSNGVSLSMSDSGIGIPKQDLNRIFDKGFTGENGRYSEQHATGLGLYLAKSLALKLGIELKADSEEKKGTTMTLVFPTLRYYKEKR